MTVLDRLDATRLASKWSDPEPSAWARPVPTHMPRGAAAEVPFSWRAWATNPNALLLTGMLSALAARDAVVRIVRV